MKNKIRPTKKDHATKNPNERRKYRDLLNMPEKTINETMPYESKEKYDEDLNIDEVITETSKDEKYKKLKKINTTDEKKPKEKPYESPSTKIIKHATEIIIGVTIIIIGAFVATIWSHHKDIATILANIDSISKDIDNLYGKYDDINNDKIETVQITTEIKKDLEFIKLRLEKIEK